MASKPKNEKGRAESKNTPGSMGRSSGEAITDPRFSSANWDPKFREAPKNKSKVNIDSRFTRMILKNKHFASSKAPIDKRGKPKRKHSAIGSLNRYYRLEGEEEGVLKRRKELLESCTDSGIEKEKSNDIGSEKDKGKISKSESEEFKSENEELKKRKKLILETESDSSDAGSEEEEESDDSSSTSTNTDTDDDVYEDEEETFVQQENIPEIDKETHRLAVVNMDWSHVKAVDLFMVLSSCLPKSGQIKSVAVYPSEFGLKRMEEEAVHGPVGLFDDDKKKSGADEGKGKDTDGRDDEDTEGDEDEDTEGDEDVDTDEDEDEDKGDEIDNEKLRAYELSRLRYYFAVVECDSVATADYLYKNCDGVEFERSSVKLDLRFIPDSMEFKHQPRDVATDAPAGYEGLDFHNRALQHSNIDLTWDDDEPHRTKTLRRKLNPDQLPELELKEFLASDESGSDDAEDDGQTTDRAAKLQEKYRALVLSGEQSDENNEDENQDMEVTFNTGLEDLSKRLLEKKDTQSETVWEAYLRKRREKKKARKNRSKDSSEDESSDNDEVAEEPDDFFEEEYPAKGNKQTRGKAARMEMEEEEKVRESEASRAELELLLADDKGTHSNLKGYNLKCKKMKGKAGKEISDEGKLPTMDYEDPRFSSLFNSPLFALDPTDPQFKRSAAYARKLTQKRQKGEKEVDGVGDRSKANGQAATPSEPVSNENNDMAKKEKHELSSLVKSLKMKAKQIPQRAKVSQKGSKLKLNSMGSR